MCKPVRSVGSFGGAARLFLAVAPLAVFFAFLAGCGGDKNPAAGAGEYALTIGIEPDNGGYVYIWIQSRDKEEFRNGDVVKITAGDSVKLDAWEGYKHNFIGWSGASTSNEATVKIKMDANKTMTARFQPVYALTVPTVTGGSVSREPEKGSYAYGDTVTLTAEPNNGYEFVVWSGTTDVTPSITIVIDGDKTLTPVFRLIPVVQDSCAADPYKVGCPNYIACQNNPTSGCPGYVEPVTYTLNVSMNPTSGGGAVNKNPNKAAYTAGETVTVTATKADGYEFTHWSGTNAPATPTENPVTITMNGNKTLTANFQQKQVTEPNCTADPYLEGCPDYCTANPTAAGCDGEPPVDPCDDNPTPACSNYCTVNPTASECVGEPPVDPCEVNLTPDCPGYCTANPTTAGCVGEPPVDPCDVTPTPSCPGYCTANPTAAGCDGEPPVDPCDANPNAPECETDPCVANPDAAGCTPSTGTYCRWNNDPTDCHAIGGPYAEANNATEAACVAASGEVVDNCSDVSTLQYCYWDVDKCYPITNPDGPCTEPCGAGLTQLQNCDLYGFVSQYSDCRDYVPPLVEYYCYWGGTTGCAKIQSPNSESTDNPGMTNLENCEKNSQPRQSFPTMAACQAYTPPAVTEYCNYGTCVGGSGWSCTSGGCYVRGEGDTCSGGTIVTSCPAGTKPPNADY